MTDTTFYRGWVEVEVDDSTFSNFMAYGSIPNELPSLTDNMGVLLTRKSDGATVTGVYKSNRGSVLVASNRTPLWDGKYHPLYPEMELMWDALWDPNIEVLSLDGIAGTGKTFTAILFGLHFVLNERKKRGLDRVVIVKPYYSSSRSAGLLPGSLDEKLEPAMQSYFDALRKILPSISGKNRSLPFQDVEDMFRSDKRNERIIEVMTLEYARGRNIENAFVILDEAQNTDENELVTFLTRNSTNCKVIISGDTTMQQKDRKELRNNSDGLSILKNCFKGLDFYSHVTVDNPDRILRGRVAKAAIERIAMRKK